MLKFLVYATAAVVLCSTAFSCSPTGTTVGPPGNPGLPGQPAMFNVTAGKREVHGAAPENVIFFQFTDTDLKPAKKALQDAYHSIEPILQEVSPELLVPLKEQMVTQQVLTADNDGIKASIKFVSTTPKSCQKLKQIVPSFVKDPQIYAFVYVYCLAD